MSRLVLTLGCHRSGTSLVTKSLECLGVSLGETLQGPAFDNLKGFHEDQEFRAINQAVLEGMGADWHSIMELPLKHVVRPNFVKVILEEKLSQHELFGLKDPRLCRLLPFWKPIFASLGTEVSCVLVVRHPDAVAKSLLERNGIPLEKGRALWLLHTLESIVDLDPSWKRVVVDYDLMLTEPTHTVCRIADALSLTIDRERLESFVLNFVDPTLRHAKGTGESYDLAGETYALLRRIAAEETDLQFNFGALMALRGKLEKMMPLLKGLDQKPRTIETGGTFKWPV